MSCLRCFSVFLIVLIVFLIVIILVKTLHRSSIVFTTKFLNFLPSINSTSSGTRITLTGQDFVVSLLTIPIFFSFPGIVDSNAIISGLQKLVDAYPMLCGRIKSGELHFGGSECVPIRLMISHAKISKLPAQSELKTLMPPLKGGSWIAFHLVLLDEISKSLLLVSVNHIVADAHSVTCLYYELARLSYSERKIPVMPISFERSGTVLSPVIADSNTNASFNELSHSFRWMSSPPLMIPSVYWSFIKLAWRTLWYQTKTFRFSAATLCLFKSEMKEQGCSLNDALVSLIITTLFVANRDRTQRKRGMHVAQIINERGQNNIPVGYIGNAHGAFTNVISVEVLEQAAIALTKFCNLEAISPIDKQLAKLNREWLLHVRTSGTIFEQLAWFDRVHYSGFNRKLGPGTAASLVNGDIIIDSFPEANDARPMPEQNSQYPLLPTEVGTTMPTAPGMVYVQSSDEGDKLITMCLPESQILAITKLWQKITVIEK